MNLKVFFLNLTLKTNFYVKLGHLQVLDWLLDGKGSLTLDGRL